MSKSSSLRVSDCRRIQHLVGECRELGVGVEAWQLHLLAGLSDLTGGLLGFCGELADFRGTQLKFLGMTDRGWAFDSDRAQYLAGLAYFLQEPGAASTLAAYKRGSIAEDGVCLAKSDLFTAREWVSTPDYELVLRPIRVKDVLWCIRTIPGADDEASIGLVLHRHLGERGFGAWDKAVVSETLEALAPLVGGPLARFADPSVAALAPRVRAVLRCLLEGDSDKQIAARLRLSPHTVNQYTKAIYRHFRARGRTDLMATWIRRGWSLQAVPTG